VKQKQCTARPPSVNSRFHVSSLDSEINRGPELSLFCGDITGPASAGRRIHPVNRAKLQNRSGRYTGPGHRSVTEYNTRIPLAPSVRAASSTLVSTCSKAPRVVINQRECHHRSGDHLSGQEKHDRCAIQ